MTLNKNAPLNAPVADLAPRVEVATKALNADAVDKAREFQIKAGPGV